MKKITALALIAIIAITAPAHGMFSRIAQLPKKQPSLQRKAAAQRTHASAPIQKFMLKISPRETLQNGKVVEWSPKQQFLDFMNYEEKGIISASERAYNYFELLSRKLQQETSTSRDFNKEFIYQRDSLISEHEQTFSLFKKLPRAQQNKILAQLKQSQK